MKKKAISVTHLGCPGHLIVARQCRWRRHTQIGDVYRISTIGDYFGSTGKRETLGAGKDSWFETNIFQTSTDLEPNSDSCGCHAVSDWSEIDGTRYSTAGAAQRGHDVYVAKYLALASKGEVGE